jgi:hypothetical protein
VIHREGAVADDCGELVFGHRIDCCIYDVVVVLNQFFLCIRTLEC